MVVVGPTSCGKSTLLRIVGGLEQLSAGELWIGGRSMHKVATRDRRIGMVSQEYALYPHLTVYDNLAFPLRTVKKAAPVRRRRAGARRRRPAEHRRSSSDCGRMTSPGARCSGSRSVGPSSATPRCLLLDEPLSNIDAFLRPSMVRELTHLQKRLGHHDVVRHP